MIRDKESHAVRYNKYNCMLTAASVLKTAVFLTLFSPFCSTQELCWRVQQRSFKVRNILLQLSRSSAARKWFCSERQSHQTKLFRYLIFPWRPSKRSMPNFLVLCLLPNDPQKRKESPRLPSVGQFSCRNGSDDSSVSNYRVIHHCQTIILFMEILPP